MKGVFIAGNSKLEIRETPDLKPHPDLVLCEVLSCGICGSDISMWHHGDMFKDILLGHEYCVRVVDPGSSDFKVGERLVGLPTGACLECETCLSGYPNICPEKRPGGKGIKPPGTGGPGAFAKYIHLRKNSLYRINDNPSDAAAALCEPISFGMSVVDRSLTEPGPADRVLVSGAGIVGVMVCESLRDRGVKYIGLIETNMNRAKQALEKGLVDEIFDGRDPDVLEKLKAAAGELGFTKAYECTGKGQPFKLMASTLGRRGELIMAGISVEDVSICNWPIIDKEIYAIGAFGSTISAFKRTIEAVEKDPARYERHITFPTLALNEVQAAFEQSDDPNNMDLKRIVDPRKEF